MAFLVNKKYVIITIIILTVSTFLFYNSKKRVEIYSESEFLMDTLVTIKVKDQSGAKEAVAQSFTVMKKWAERLDRHDENSAITSINKYGSKGVQVASEIIYLFSAAGKYYRLSNGAFDITIAPLLDLWGFGKQKQAVPSQEEVNKALARVGFSKLLINQKNNFVYLKPDMKVDLGGMAKGFIVDKGISSLEDSGIKSAFINAGGNIRVLGSKYTGRPWHVGIRKPGQEGEIFTDYIIGMEEGSVATSGDYERYFTYNGKRYSHLLDPRTGYQARDMQAVTIFAPDAFTADILSTAIFIMGREEGQKLINELTGVEGFMVWDESDIWLSEGFKDLVINQ